MEQSENNNYRPAQSPESASESAAANSPAESAAADSTAVAKRTFRLRMIAVACALGGLVMGSTVSYFVSSALNATGVFGNPLDAIVQEQKTNFTDIRAKLDALAKAPPGSPESKQLQKDLVTLVGSQEKLADHANAEMKSLQDEVTSLREQALQDNRSVSGADFWLQQGETVTLVDRNSVFALATVYRGGTVVDVNLSGKVTRLNPGDFVQFSAGDTVCKVYYKVSKARADGRYGFDLVVTPK